MSNTTENKIDFIDPKEVIEFDNEVPEEDFKDIEESELESEPTPYADSLKELSAVEYIAKKEEDTRGRLAVLYTLSTFFIFVLGFLVAILDGLIRKVSIIENISTILPLISGIFLGSLGFVIGYYFKKSDEK